MLTVERLKELLVYDKETGMFSWRRPVIGSKERVGCHSRAHHRYIRVCLDGKHYYAHRLAWLYVYGEWPSMIDHKDGNGRNNRLSNLRLSTPRSNQFNRKVSPKGVYLSNGKWRVQVGRGPNKHIGIFDTREEALAARQTAIEGMLR